MARSSALAAVLALAGTAVAQCGSSADAVVDGSSGSYTAVVGGSEVYSGSDYLAAITAALDGSSSVAVLADGSIGEGTISLASGQTFEGCGVIDVGNNGAGSIQITDVSDVSVPFLSLTGSPYFGIQIYGASDISLGQIELAMSGGLGIRSDRDEARSSNVNIDSVTVSGTDNHGVELWNIDGLDIGEVIARDVAYSGLLIENSIDVTVGLVDGDNVGAGTGYATLRFANRNGRQPDGTYPTSIYVDRVVSRGGGRGVFCVSESGGAEIGEVDLADNGNNAILIENCYNLQILSGTVDGGGEVRLSARDEFPLTSGILIDIEVNNNSVREDPCADNTSITISGDASVDIC